nr:hypothetical protein Iba_chr03aCG19010 [Ipomoea batatas]
MQESEHVQEIESEENLNILCSNRIHSTNERLVFISQSSNHRYYKHTAYLHIQSLGIGGEAGETEKELAVDFVNPLEISGDVERKDQVGLPRYELVVDAQNRQRLTDEEGMCMADHAVRELEHHLPRHAPFPGEYTGLAVVENQRHRRPGRCNGVETAVRK